MSHCLARVLPFFLLPGACATPSPAPPGAPPEAALVEQGEDGARDEALLEAFLQRVLADGVISDTAFGSVELVEARRFSEGHVNEVWYLALDVDGQRDHAVLKLFESSAAARENEVRFAAAHDHGWPVPTELVRDVAVPFSDRTAVLMEYVVGGSLSVRLKALGEDGATPPPDRVAALYADVAATLARLHARHVRPRADDDRLDRPALLAMSESCERGGWCDAAAAKRIAGYAAHLDDGPVRFCHGDLYESQVILDDSGRFKAFIDLDYAGYADPASDVGALLAHVLIINPAAREAAWKMVAPSEAEQRETAAAILRAYRGGRPLADPAWSSFLLRVRAHAWLRLGELMVRYGGRKRAAPMFSALVALESRLAAEDPFEAYGLLPSGGTP